MARPFRLHLQIIVALLCAVIGSFCYAQNYGTTKAELGLLPEYCKFVQGGDLGKEDFSSPSVNAQKYIARWGSNHWHLHHFCWAKVKQMRSMKYSASLQQKQGLREQAIGDLDYSIRHSTSDFELLPDLETNRGILLVLLNRDRDAIVAFKNALEHSAKFAPAYTELIAVLRKQGDKEGAKKVFDLAIANGISMAKFEEIK